jgi:DNA-binding LacI/PurR family transcriptional regulator
MTSEKDAKVTIKFIASQMGISFSTVSKALNNDPLVKEETRIRVQEKAAELGYFPNVFARGLRSKTTKTIGVILNDIENPTRTHIIKCISIEMAKYGFTTLIFDSQYDLAIEKRNILSVLSRMPDGIVISPVSTNKENLELLQSDFPTTIVLSRIFDSIPANYVHMDHKQGGYISASTMIDNGHINNLIITEPIDFPSSAQFLEGVKQAYQEHSILFKEDMVVYAIPSIESGVDAICSLYNQRTKTFDLAFTGVIANYDMFAFGVYRSAEKLGLKIPDDISVIGYDDNPVSSWLTPPLTTMYMPKEDIASHCTEILISKLINDDNTIQKYTLHPHLVIRNSIKKIN